jgi:hypothetical protein
VTDTSTASTGARADSLLLDTFMPTCDASIAEHAIVRADVATTFAAARGLDFLQLHTPLLDAAMWLRGVPGRLVGDDPPVPKTLVLGEGDPLPGWLVLGERPDRELTFGAVGRFWRPQIEWRDVQRDDFTAFAEPGWGKIAADFLVTPHGEHASLLTYECRTKLTDDDSRRRFSRYWSLVRPFVGYIFRVTVRSIRDHAEGVTGREDRRGATA